jgi:hypothetical protein
MASSRVKTKTVSFPVSRFGRPADPHRQLQWEASRCATWTCRLAVPKVRGPELRNGGWSIDFPLSMATSSTVVSVAVHKPTRNLEAARVFKSRGGPEDWLLPVQSRQRRDGSGIGIESTDSPRHARFDEPQIWQLAPAAISVRPPSPKSSVTLYEAAK